MSFTTARLVLRKLTPDDVGNLLDLDSDPEVMRFLTRGVPSSLQYMRDEAMPRIMQANALGDHLGFWGVRDRAADAFLGWIHLRPDRISPDDMELGYRFKRAAWGRGVATEGSLAVIEQARRAGVTRFSARTLVVNVASRRVMEKVGMQFESEFTWPPAILPGWTDEERRGVKYVLITSR